MRWQSNRIKEDHRTSVIIPSCSGSLVFWMVEGTILPRLPSIQCEWKPKSRGRDVHDSRSVSRVGRFFRWVRKNLWLIKQKSWVDIITKITDYGQGVMGRMNELECYNFEKGYGHVKVTTLVTFGLRSLLLRLLSESLHNPIFSGSLLSVS